MRTRLAIHSSSHAPGTAQGCLPVLIHTDLVLVIMMSCESSSNLAVCNTSGPAMLGRGLPVGQHPLRRQRRVHPQWRRHGDPCFLMIAVCLVIA